MATYGKKKRSILPSLSIPRDSNVASNAEHKPPRERESLVPTMSPFYQLKLGEYHHDDSIGEMASMLLDDTVEDPLKPDPGRRLSQIPSAKTLPNLSHAQAEDPKSLPQLPTLNFNGYDAWTKTVPIVTAAGNSKSIYFVQGSDGTNNCSPIPVTRANFGKDSAPAIPRKSSKRQTVHPISGHAKFQFGDDRKKALKSTISHPKLLIPVLPQQVEAIDVSKKVQATLAATKALKGQTQHQKLKAKDGNNKIKTIPAATSVFKGGTAQALLQGPYLPAYKRGPRGNKVFAKVKTAINDGFRVRNPRRRDSAQDDQLLDPSRTQIQDLEETLALSALEIRLNEGRFFANPFSDMLNHIGHNFENPKVFNLTGHGVVRRKPVADDGKSLKSFKSSTRSRQSADDSFLGVYQSSILTRTPTSFENKIGVDMSLDQSGEFIPDLPNLYDHTPKKEMSRSQMPNQYRYGSDIDALLSSSPQAQSTPRLRLEPSFEENGRKILKNVPANSRSVFDFNPDSSYVVQSPTMAVDSEQANEAIFVADSAKRKNSRSTLTGGGKRSKKHPSPSKEELEGLELAMKNFPFSDRGEAPFVNKTGRGALSSKDANELKAAKRTMQDKVTFARKEQTKITKSIPNLGTKDLKSAMRKPALEKGGLRQYFSQSNLTDGSMMDLDELQWDDIEYNIGMGRF